MNRVIGSAVYIREALTTFFDPYSQIANNIYQFVAETRLARRAATVKK
jgi:hypothetical protein